MPLFSYQALDARGRRKKGLMDASSSSVVWQKLKETGLYPTRVAETATLEKREKQELPRELWSRIRQQEVTAATRNLATLLSAGLPLMSALGILIEQTSHQGFRRLLAGVREDVRGGRSLSAALAPHAAIFSPLYLFMVQAAEASGSLPAVMERLADFREHQQAIRTKIKSALAYPLLMLLVGSAILVFLVLFVIPSITDIFQEMNQQLPAVTVILIEASQFMGRFWWLLGGAALGLILALRRFLRENPTGRHLADRIKLRLPFLGALIRKLAVARFSRTLGALLQSGVPMLTALDIAQKVVNNVVLSEGVTAAAQEVMQGENLSRSLARRDIFPPMATEMLALGEHSGNLEAMLFKIADAYEKEGESKIMLATSLVEPIMILLMGFIVGFVVVAILLPLFEMNQLVR